MEINFNPNINKNLPVDFFIKNQLEKLGLQPTGSKEGDIKAIQNALSEKKLPEANNILNQDKLQPKPPRTPEAVAVFMRKLGLEPANSKETDNALITSKLSELESKAKTPEEIKNAKNLREEFESIIINAGTAGQEISGMMNKSFFNLKS